MSVKPAKNSIIGYCAEYLTPQWPHLPLSIIKERTGISVIFVNEDIFKFTPDPALDGDNSDQDKSDPVMIDLQNDNEDE